MPASRKVGAVPAKASPSKTSLAPLILIVEDYLDNREMLEESLQYFGFRTESAVDGEEAIGKAIRLVPDVILMDLGLPVIDGWEAIRRIRIHPRTQGTIIIVISAHGLPADENRARMAGCDSFLTKPVYPEEVLREVRKLLDHPPR